MIIKNYREIEDSQYLLTSVFSSLTIKKYKDRKNLPLDYQYHLGTKKRCKPIKVSSLAKCVFTSHDEIIKDNSFILPKINIFNERLNDVEFITIKPRFEPKEICYIKTVTNIDNAVQINIFNASIEEKIKLTLDNHNDILPAEVIVENVLTYYQLNKNIN